MINLSQLVNTSRPKVKVQRIGRGCGSKRGKTSTRGHKGDKSRSGYTRRIGQEGGQLPLYRKLPTRGFSNARFRVEYLAINLDTISTVFEDGEVVSKETLIQKGFSASKLAHGFKVLAVGDITKGVVIKANAISGNALKKLEEKKIQFSLI